MSSSPVCTCSVCPLHGESVSGGGGRAGDRPGWAGPAREYLDSVVDWLDGPEAMGAGHGELEARLQVRSREHYRLLLQGHLLERARREERRSGVTGSDGVPRPRVENGHRRELTSVFGPVSVTRKAYRAVPGHCCRRRCRHSCTDRLRHSAGPGTGQHRPEARGGGDGGGESTSGGCGAEPAGGQAFGGTGAVGGGGGGAGVVRRCPGGDRAGDRGGGGQAAGGGPGPHGRGGRGRVLRRPPPAVRRRARAGSWACSATARGS